MGYFGIHNHTDVGSNQRLCDSTNKVKDLIEYSHELGLKGVCITDHESLSAHIDALDVLSSHKKDEDWQEFKVGLGNEIYLCNRPDGEISELKKFPHFILIALDNEGHQCLRELSTNSWVNNAFMNVMYRIPTFYDELYYYISKYKGHVVGSSACLGSPLCRKLLEYKSLGEPDYIWEACINWIEYMNILFGTGYFFLEMQPNYDEEQMYVNSKLLELSKITDIPFIITTDAHYLKKEDREIHKTYLQSKEGEREVDSFYATTYVMSEKEIHEYMDENIGFDNVTLGLDNTLTLYHMIKGYELEKDLHIPYIPLNKKEPDAALYNKYKEKIPLLESFYTSRTDSDRHMTRALLEAIEKDESYLNDSGYDKINECLDYVKRSSEKNKADWSAYLMQVSDYVDIAWKAGSLVGPGRGSGVGFCLLDLLGITQINPLREETQTYPWRFLNPDRVSVLDIDIDIMSSKRDTVVNALKAQYGELNVVKVLTMQTEKSKAAILTAARGLGISNDEAAYIASLVIYDRGQPRTLKQMYYGDDDYKPSAEFVREMEKHPKLWEACQKIEGLVSGIGSHAGGVVIVDEPITNSAALMRTKSGDIVTQYDLHTLERLSLIKIDLLSIDALDKIYETLMLLLKDDVIKWQGTLKDTYEKYIGIYTLERQSEDMWKLLWEHKVLSFFQMEKQSGTKAIALVKPHSVDDLATLNSVIRLMAQEEGAESPLEKYARFHKDISLWYKEMQEAGLNEDEQELLKKYLSVSSGICEAQEYLMIMSMDKKIAGFDLMWADSLRKAIAKKKPKDFNKLQDEFFKNRDEKHLSKNLTNYVWYVLFYTQRGYGFNKSHTLAYSLVGLQELNLAYKYNILYWNCANLVVDSGSLDEESNDATNYGKTAVAISKMQHEGVNISLPLINEADFGFKPDIKNEQIIFGLKGINGINTNLSQAIIENRPYVSIEDFAFKMLDGTEEKPSIIKKSQMLQLIKGGCFTKLHSNNRMDTMDWFLKKYVFKPCESLSLQQLKRIKEMDIIPEKFELAYAMINFKKYVLSEEFLIEKYIDENKKMVKRGYHDGHYVLDQFSMPFFKKHFTEESVIALKGEFYVVSEKKIIKEADSYIKPFKEWLDDENTLKLYNERLYEEVKDQYAKGSQAAWNMEALTYYDPGNHELENLNESKYGIVDYYKLPEEPVAYDYYTRNINGTLKKIPKFKISCIAGTVIMTDNNHHTITLLTKYGPVLCKINKGHYAFYNKRISKLGEDGKKHVIEDSWFKRGTMLRICGIKRDDMFFPLNYTDTIYSHTINKIISVNDDGTVELQYERSHLTM